MKVGDCVKMDYQADECGVERHYWTGICTWTDGYKFEFLIAGEFDTWTRSDLEVAGAEVINGAVK